jgi:hypothetical protein
MNTPSEERLPLSGSGGSRSADPAKTEHLRYAWSGDSYAEVAAEEGTTSHKIEFDADLPQLEPTDVRSGSASRPRRAGPTSTCHPAP